MTRHRLSRLESRLFRLAIERFGAEIDHSWILEVPGRRTGIPRFTPVKLLDVGAERFLVALYRGSDWSRNLRAASGVARLRRRGVIQPVVAAELPPEDRPRVLRAYLAAATRSKTLDILGAGERDPDDGHLRRIAPDHPVFLITLPDGQGWPSSGRADRVSGQRGRSTSRVRSPGAGRWAVISGGAGLASGLFLILFFGVARPFSGEPSRWAWFGPANDLTSAVQAGALIPVALALRDLMPHRGVQRWTVIGVAAMGAATILPLLLVGGLMPFAIQAPLVTFVIAVMFCWLYAVNRAGRRHGVLSRSATTVGTTTSVAVGVAAVIAGVAALMPSRSAVQYLAFGLAAVPGVIAWLGFPAWTLLVARALGVDPAVDPAPSEPEGGNPASSPEAAAQPS